MLRRTAVPPLYQTFASEFQDVSETEMNFQLNWSHLCLCQKSIYFQLSVESRERIEERGRRREGGKNVSLHLISAAFPQRAPALSRGGAEIFYRGLLIHYSHLPELAIITALYIEPRRE